MINENVCKDDDNATAAFVYTEGADVPEDIVRIRIDPPDISANAFQNQLGNVRIG